MDEYNTFLSEIKAYKMILDQKSNELYRKREEMLLKMYTLGDEILELRSEALKTIETMEQKYNEAVNDLYSRKEHV